MTQRSKFHVLCVLLAGLGCTDKRKQSVVAPSPDENVVTFKVQPVTPVHSMDQAWSCSYTSSGKTAKFVIQLRTPGSPPGSDKNSFAFGKGEFLAVKGSDAASLISQLKMSLQAKSEPHAATRASSLPFVFAILGRNESPLSGGGFTERPPGDWSTYKLFIGKNRDDEEAEIFLNLNAKDGSGQFSMKDPDYGDTLLQYLATVL